MGGTYRRRDANRSSNKIVRHGDRRGTRQRGGVRQKEAVTAKAVQGGISVAPWREGGFHGGGWLSPYWSVIGRGHRTESKNTGGARHEMLSSRPAPEFKRA